MSPDAIQSAPAAQHPQTGPRTHEGKAASSQNAPRLKQETPPYPIKSTVVPEACGQDGPFADEIVTAKWRLRRCGLIESHLALRADTECSLSEDDEKRQRSVDRARAQYNNLLRRVTADLRKVQTERVLRKEIGTVGNFGVADFSAMFRGVKLADTVSKVEQRNNQAAQEAGLQQAIQAIETAAASYPPPRPPEKSNTSFCNSAGLIPEQAELHPPSPSSNNSFCKPAASAPGKSGRNEPCPCKSGLKYKRCCLNKPKTEAKQAV